MKKLKRMRESVGFSQYALAKKSGVSQGAISHFEKGKREPRLKSLRALAKALGCEMRDLV